MKRMTALILTLVSTMLVSACSNTANADDSGQDRLYTVKTAEVRSAGAETVRDFPGVVKPKKSVTMSFLVSGEVVAISVSEGEAVKKGEVVAKIDDTSYRLEYLSAEARLHEAELSYNRAKGLLTANSIPQAEYDRAEVAYRVATATFEQVKKRLRDTVLRAPYDGVIAAVMIDDHQAVSQSTPVAVLQDVSAYEVHVNVPEGEVASLVSRKDVAAKVSLSGSRRYPATLKELGTSADPTTQTYPAIFLMQKPEDRTILPGMTATVHIGFPAKSDDAGTVVPVGAIQSNPDGSAFVWIVARDMTVTRRPVELGSAFDGEINVTSGLSAGETVVVAGANSLEDGARVRPLERR